jgi:hypothetical protein
MRRSADCGSGAGFSGARRHRVYRQQHFQILDPPDRSNGSVAGAQPGDRRHRGSNDVSNGEDAGPIVARTKRFIQILHEKSPNTYFFYTAIQKAPEKRERWDVVEEVNREMERYSREAVHVGFIDLNPVLFDKQNNVREDLFLPDGLHFRTGSTAYREFAQIVKPILSRAWENGAGLAGSK